MYRLGTCVVALLVVVALGGGQVYAQGAPGGGGAPGSGAPGGTDPGSGAAAAGAVPAVGGRPAIGGVGIAGRLATFGAGSPNSAAMAKTTFNQLAVDANGQPTQTVTKEQWLKQREEAWAALCKAAGKENATELTEEDFAKAAQTQGVGVLLGGGLGGVGAILTSGVRTTPGAGRNPAVRTAPGVVPSIAPDDAPGSAPGSDPTLVAPPVEVPAVPPAAAPSGAPAVAPAVDPTGATPGS